MSASRLWTRGLPIRYLAARVASYATQLLRECEFMTSGLHALADLRFARRTHALNQPLIGSYQIFVVAQTIRVNAQ